MPRSTTWSIIARRSLDIPTDLGVRTGSPWPSANSTNAEISRDSTDRLGGGEKRTTEMEAGCQANGLPDRFENEGLPGVSTREFRPGIRVLLPGLRESHAECSGAHIG